MKKNLRPIVVVGTQLRHKYFLSVLLEEFELAGVIFYERTLVQPSPLPHQSDKEDLLIEELHLSKLQSKEKEYFLDKVTEINLEGVPVLTVKNRAELNHRSTISWIEDLGQSEVFLDYGSGVLSNEFLSTLPRWKINLHGGISPYYKGSATLLWPLYMQQPELIGTTFHVLSEKIDGGEIIQHTRPNLSKLDSVADIGCKAIVDASYDAIKLLKKLDKTGSLDLYKQPTGKLFLERDYKPSCIRVVNTFMSRGMIEKYLSNKSEIDAQYNFVNQL